MHVFTVMFDQINYIHAEYNDKLLKKRKSININQSINQSY